MKKKVLITDDDAGIQDVYKIIFERAGYSTLIFTDGKPLLEDNYEYPDIYVLDRYLSGSDGLEICRYLKSREMTRSIPVIMISATPGIAQLAREAGADDFLEKPFKSRELLDVIARHITK
ncbi:PleD family two-component system response regulator [Telluribacter sp. SYSU D00476]|uniref:response regulator n=1 Tax=Telluribacter sp. SYSU D00476 TaxID=2811430 RepID=UPI001FF57B45|nr:response regulator [Telluribacter sp. SYSU D00476]